MAELSVAISRRICHCSLIAAMKKKKKKSANRHAAKAATTQLSFWPHHHFIMDVAVNAGAREDAASYVTTGQSKPSQDAAYQSTRNIAIAAREAQRNLRHHYTRIRAPLLQLAEGSVKRCGVADVNRVGRVARATRVAPFSGVTARF